MAGSSDGIKKAWETRRKAAQQDVEGVRARRRDAAIRAWQVRREKAKADPEGAAEKRRLAAFKAWSTRRLAIGPRFEEVQLKLRLPREWLNRADALLDRLLNRTSHYQIEPRRGKLLRAALIRGLELIEREEADAARAIAHRQETSLGRNRQNYQETIFKIIEEIIDQLYQQTGVTVVHDAIAAALRKHDVGSAVLQRRQQQLSTAPTLEQMSSNMVAWFSAKVTQGEAQWGARFIRKRLMGKWAYEPKAQTTGTETVPLR